MKRRDLLWAGPAAWAADAAVPPQSSAAQTALEAAANAVVKDPSYPPGNVRRYGATGLGTQDDTAAFNAAFAYANYIAFSWFNPGPPLDYLKLAAGVVQVPAGDYLYNGPGFTARTLAISLQGEGCNVTRIRLGKGVVLLSGEAAQFASVKAITTYGGSGLYNLTGTGSNVEGRFEFEDINAFGYTGCYIGHCFRDAPDWCFRRMILHGALDASGERQSLGLVVGGLTDGATFEDIDFQENLIHIKFNGGGIYGANHAYIKRCDFYRWSVSTRGKPSFDIWIVPDTEPPSVHVNGDGITISENKFGNENLLTTDYRVVIADEDTASGTNRLTRMPQLKSNSAGFVGGMIVRDNSVYGSARGSHVTSRALIYSFTPNLWQIEADNKFNGAFMPTLDYYRRALTNRLPQNTLNRVRMIHMADVGLTSAPVEPMTSGTGWFADEHSIYQGFQSIPTFHTSGFDPSYADLSPHAFVMSWETNDAQVSPITDSVGGNEAGEVTLRADGGIRAVLANSPATGRPGYISLDLRRAASEALERIRVLLQDRTGSYAVLSRTINLLPYWRRVTIPFIVPGNDAVIDTLRICSFEGDYSPQSCRFQLGKVRIYHAFEAQHPGTRYLDSGRVPWSPGSIAPGATATLDVPVTGAQFGDLCLASYAAELSGFVLGANVSAADSVQVGLYNPTQQPARPAPSAVRVRVFKAI